MTQSSALYRGQVTHQRMRPRRHRLNYRAFWLLLDLAELDGLDARLRLFSRDRFNLLSFFECDHGDGSQRPLTAQIEAYLDRAGIDLGPGSAIQLLTMPRVLGYVFNPISVYYCRAADGHLAAVIYEVTSTFKVRHSYVIPVPAEEESDGAIHQTCDKALHVSPFMGMDMDYTFGGRAPGAALDLTIGASDADGMVLIAAITACRDALSDRTILSAVTAIPLLTLKVVAAIHWEALKLWIKGVPLAPRPPDPQGPATIVGAQGRVKPR